MNRNDTKRLVCFGVVAAETRLTIRHFQEGLSLDGLVVSVSNDQHSSVDSSWRAASKLCAIVRGQRHLSMPKGAARGAGRRAAMRKWRAEASETFGDVRAASGSLHAARCNVLVLHGKAGCVQQRARSARQRVGAIWHEQHQAGFELAAHVIAKATHNIKLKGCALLSPPNRIYINHERPRSWRFRNIPSELRILSSRSN